MAPNSEEPAGKPLNDEWRLNECPETRGVKSLGFIVDGNGRWATQQGLSRSCGHAAGLKVVEKLVTHCARLKTIEFLYLYLFSVENWRRGEEEIQNIFRLGESFVNKFRAVHEKNSHGEEARMLSTIRLIHLGEKNRMPPLLREELDRLVEHTKDNQGMSLVLCFDYGGRTEICRAMQNILHRTMQSLRTSTTESQENKLAESIMMDNNILHVTDDIVESALYGASLHLKDPDLIIRTAGELRLSNFLCWQSVYSELVFVQKTFPEFGPKDLRDAFDEFARRSRRYGATPPA